MARKKPEPKTIEQLTADNRQNALRQFFSFERTLPQVIPQPTRTFVVGEEVLYGNRDNCTISEVLCDGKGYLIEMDEAKRRDEKPTGARDFIAAWWFQVEKTTARHTNGRQLFEPFTMAQHSKCDLESVFHMMQHGGLVCDPVFQREYVWTDADRTALLDSIFERLEIGSFLFVRHHGYLHKNSSGNKVYRNFDGELITIENKDDYTISVIDGQQRLTTLFNFYADKFTYRGLTFSQLHRRDQIEFEQFAVTYRTFEEENVDQKTLLKLFLQCNRGVPQAPEHIAAVQAMYDALK